MKQKHRRSRPLSYAGPRCPSEVCTKGFHGDLLQSHSLASGTHSEAPQEAFAEWLLPYCWKGLPGGVVFKSQHLAAPASRVGRCRARLVGPWAGRFASLWVLRASPLLPLSLVLGGLRVGGGGELRAEGVLEKFLSEWP